MAYNPYEDARRRKRMATLEKENQELKDKLSVAQKKIGSLSFSHVVMDVVSAECNRLRQKIKELKRENEKLKQAKNES